MSKAAPTVAISYAWKEEQLGEHAQTVERLCAKLRGQGIEVLWDKEALSPGEDLRDFMWQIGTANFLCVFLSDAYLRSANCMNELLIAWECSQNRPGEFKERVKVWIMPSARDIFQVAGRLTYTDFWQAECAKLEPLVSKHATRGLHGEDLNQFNRMKQYAEKVNEIIAFISGKLAPQDFAQFEHWVCSLLPAAFCVSEIFPTTPSPTNSRAPAAPPKPVVPTTPAPRALPSLPDDLEQKLREVFGAQYQQLEAILQKRRELRELLTARFHLDLVTEAQLIPALILEFHRSFLKALGEFGQILENDPAQRDAVLELVSTVLFLSMAPEFAQALLYQPDAMEFGVAENARQGIAEMLLCWNRRQGKGPIPVKVLSREKQSGTWECPPQMELSDLRRALMSSLNVDAALPNAEATLEEKLERRAHFGHPAMHVISAENRALFDAIRRDTRLRNLVLLLKATGNTINSNPEVGANYDRRFEDHLAELVRVAQPQP